MHRKNSMEVRLVVEHEHEAQRGPRRVGQSVARVLDDCRVGLPIFRFREEEDPPSFVLAVAFAKARRIGSKGGVLHNFVSDARSASLSGAWAMSSSKRAWSFITATGASLFSSAAIVASSACSSMGGAGPRKAARASY